MTSPPVASACFERRWCEEHPSPPGPEVRSYPLTWVTWSNRHIIVLLLAPSTNERASVPLSLPLFFKRTWKKSHAFTWDTLEEAFGGRGIKTVYFYSGSGPSIHFSRKVMLTTSVITVTESLCCLGFSFLSYCLVQYSALDSISFQSLFHWIAFRQFWYFLNTRLKTNSDNR